MLRIYNTLSRKKEEFIPIKKGKVGIYGCGVTPYKPSHLGHAMQAVIFDVIRRYLEYKGNDVTYVRNYTDVDDRIIELAAKEGISAIKYSQRIISQCEADFKNLRVRPADYEPKVTDNINGIINAVSILVEKGFAYVTDKGNVYYSVEKFPKYGHLSGQRLDKMKRGVRKSLEDDKREYADFALWKSSKPGEISWDSPWGNGRPGWHIECSVMSMKHLGKQIDIHGGGLDLVFPHHENEIAQSEAMNNNKFVNYWLHNGLLMVGEDKMSKSLGNDISISSWIEKYNPEVIRYLILTNHYRSHVQFISERYRDANRNVYGVYKTLQIIKKITGTVKVDKKYLDELMSAFEASMDDDFNTVEVVASFHKLINDADEILGKKNLSEEERIKISTISSFIQNTGKILGLFDLEPSEVLADIRRKYLKQQGLSEESVETKIKERNLARQDKNFVKADKIRKELEEKGVVLEDTNVETKWSMA